MTATAAVTSATSRTGLLATAANAYPKPESAAGNASASGGSVSISLGGTQNVFDATTAVPIAPTFLSVVEADLVRVEERLIAETRSDIAAVRDISGHTLLSGGKRLRPAVAILSARVVGKITDLSERTIAAASAAEMIHMATLMHDDVVDESSERRGRPTANAVYGNGITILTGDFLLAKAISLLVHNHENLDIVRVFSDVTVAMAEGEVLQAAVAHDLTIAQSVYEEIIDRKTARFIAGCCETGAMLGLGAGADVAALRAYGQSLGMAFQIADDLLDFLGDSERTGKPLGTDLRDGRVTLPLLHALAHAGDADKSQLAQILSQESVSDADIADVTDIITRSGGFDAARQVASGHIEQAVASLSGLPRSVWKTALADLAHYVLVRDR